MPAGPSRPAPGQAEPCRAAPAPFRVAETCGDASKNPRPPQRPCAGRSSAGAPPRPGFTRRGVSGFGRGRQKTGRSAALSRPISRPPDRCIAQRGVHAQPPKPAARAATRRRRPRGKGAGRPTGTDAKPPARPAHWNVKRRPRGRGGNPGPGGPAPARYGLKKHPRPGPEAEPGDGRQRAGRLADYAVETTGDFPVLPTPGVLFWNRGRPLPM